LTEQDIFAFFAKHDVVEMIADISKAVRLITKQNGKASGQAVVMMRNKEDAEYTQGRLHGQWIGSRYIEVFLSGDDGGVDLETPATGAQFQLAANAAHPDNEPMDIAYGADCMGDTGGSGGMPPSQDPSAAQNLAAWQQEFPWTTAGPYGMNLDASAAGSGEGAPKDMGDASWGALFDFLKRDGVGGAGLPSSTHPDAQAKLSGI
jgi:hypothetical protein